MRVLAQAVLQYKERAAIINMEPLAVAGLAAPAVTLIQTAVLVAAGLAQVPRAVTQLANAAVVVVVLMLLAAMERHLVVVVAADMALTEKAVMELRLVAALARLAVLPRAAAVGMQIVPAAKAAMAFA